MNCSSIKQTWAWFCPWAMRVSAPELKLTQLGLPMFLAWEFLQSPFYTDTFTESWTGVLYNRVHCTGGDMIILLGAFWVVALLWGRSWIAQEAAAPRVLFIASGLLYTIFSEYRNVYITHTWAYSGWMATIGGIGLVPVIQWLIVPTVLLYVIRNSAFKRKASYGH